MAREKSELELEMNRVYKNYLARRRYAAKKYGEENLPELIPRPSKESVTAEDLGVLERQRAGVFEESYQKKHPQETNEPIPPSIPEEVNKVLARFDMMRNEFTTQKGRDLFDEWFGSIKATYTPYQIAYIYLKNVDDLESWLDWTLQYDKGSGDNPKIKAGLEKMSKVFNTKYPSEAEAVEYFTSTKEFYDAGEDEEWQEGDYSDIFM